MMLFLKDIKEIQNAVGAEKTGRLLQRENQELISSWVGSDKLKGWEKYLR